MASLIKFSHSLLTWDLPRWTPGRISKAFATHALPWGKVLRVEELMLEV